MPEVHALRGGIEQQLAKHSSVKEVVNAFRLTVVQLLRDHSTKDTAVLFQSHGHGQRPKNLPRLLALGVTGKWRQTSTHPNWPPQLCAQVEQAILRHRGVPQRLDTGLAQGPQVVRPRPLPRSQPPTWRSSRNNTHHATNTTESTSRDGSKAQGYQVGCQHCQATTVLADKPTLIGRQSQILRCYACRRRIALSAMRCQLCRSRVSQCDCTVGKKAYRQTTIADMFKGAPPLAPCWRS